MQLVAFKVSLEQISLSTAHFAARFSQVQARLLTRGLLVALLTLQSIWRPNYITKHYAINVEDFGVSRHMLKRFYMAPFLSLSCPSLLSCRCPIWDGICLAITACGSWFVLYLVKTTLPQSKCLCWMSGCGCAWGCGAGQTTIPASTPHLSPWWDIPHGHLQTTQGKRSVLVPPAACFTLLSPEATWNQGCQRSLLCLWTAAVPPHGLWPVSVQSTWRYHSRKRYTVFITEVCQP